MATKFATAYVDVDANLAPLHKRLKGIGRLGGLAGLAIGAGIAVELKSAISAFTETEKVGKQTNAVLKSTGQTAGVTAKHVGDLATALSKKSGMDDEAVQSAENLLLTFTNVRNEVGKGNKIFDRATSTVADMSAALGQDLKSSSIQLGKALNDPVKGITALQRVGVTFTAQQKDQIKTLVGSGNALDDLKAAGVDLTAAQKQQVNVTGDLADPLKAASDLGLKLTDTQRKQLKAIEDGTGRLQAQKIVLGELNKEFGGSAAAQAQPLDRLKVSLGNIQEAIGSGFKPAVDAVATDLTHLADKVLPSVQGAADDVAAVFAGRGSLGDKISKAFDVAKVDLAPLGNKLGASIRSQEFGKKIEGAVEFLTPKIAEGMAHAAPRAAATFVRVFKNTDIWGQLLTAGFLIGKLGGFSAAGKWAAGSLFKAFAPRAAVEASASGAASGTAFATGFKATAAAALAEWIPPVAAATVVVAFSYEISKKLADLLGIPARGTALGDATDPVGGAFDDVIHGRNPLKPDHPRRSHPHGHPRVRPKFTYDPKPRPPHRRPPRHHPRPPRTSGGAVAHLSSFGGDAAYGRMGVDAGASVARDATAPIARTAARHTRRVRHPRHLSPHTPVVIAQHAQRTTGALSRFMDDLALAPSFDDVFVNQTGLRKAIVGARKHPRPHHRKHHATGNGTGGIQAPNVISTDNRSVKVDLHTTTHVDPRYVATKIARELDRLG